MSGALAEVAAYDLVERDRRWGVVRSLMADAAVDLLVVLPQSDPTDARYLAQEYGAVLFPAEGDPWIVVGGEDSHLAVERPAWIGLRSSATPGGSNRAPWGAVVAERLRALRPPLRRVGIAGLDCSKYSHVRSADGYVLHATVRRIAEAVGSAEIVDGSPIMAAARYVKSEAEIASVRSATAVAERGCAALQEHFAIGRTQAEVYRSGFVAMMEPGVSNPFGAVPLIAWCPGQWGELRPRYMGTPPGRIDDGLCVSTELITMVNGCFAQVAEPFVAGAVTAEQQAMFDLNVESFDVLCKALVPGASWRAAKEAVAAVSRGTAWQSCFLLHGGQDGPLLVPGDTHDEWLDDPVTLNTVLICKPHVFPASQPEVVARSHDLTWGDTVVVREDGAERLGSRRPDLVPYR